MATETTAQAPVQAPAQEEQPRITCFVTKRLVPQSETVEVEYSPGRKVWVQTRYLRYEFDKSAKK
jgi:hypothetical protein